MTNDVAARSLLKVCSLMVLLPREKNPLAWRKIGKLLFQLPKYFCFIMFQTSHKPLPQKKHAQHLTQFNQNIFKRNVLTDVECVVQGRVFKTHRALLVCFSPYLKKKLVNSEGKPISKQVQLPSIGSKEFEIILQYMYTGNLDINCNTFLDVYKAISILEMRDAKLECLQLIRGKDEIKTYFYSYVLCKKLGMQQNWVKAFKLITHRFEEAVFSKEFMQLNLNSVIEILKAESIGARSEIIVFLAALNWLNYDFKSREIHAVTVMECVRFSSMSMKEIIACYHPPFLSSVIRIPDVMMMLYQATCYIAAKSQGQENLFSQYAYAKRKLTLDCLPMNLWIENTVSTDIENHVLESDKSFKQSDNDYESDIKEPSTSSKATIPKSATGQIFRGMPYYSDDFENYNKHDLNEIHEQYQHQSIPLQESKVGSNEQERIKEGCILVIGGMNPNKMRKEDGRDVRILNLKTNDWRHYSRIPESRCNHCAEILNNDLFVIAC